MSSNLPKKLSTNPFSLGEALKSGVSRKIHRVDSNGGALMIFDFEKSRVFIYQQPIDMRAGFERLAFYVR